MIIGVGSTNQIKVAAVRESFSESTKLSVKVIEKNVPSGVSEQPMSLEETIVGARNRAQRAFTDRMLWSVGIESGLMHVPHANTGMMNVCVCVIYSEGRYIMGLSSAFEYPPSIIRLINSGTSERPVTANDACRLVGLTADHKIGNKEGAIGILTKGRLNRKEYIKQAIMNALIQRENYKLY